MTQNALAVTGVNVANYAVAGFAYDAATFTATWTLSTAGVANDKLALNLAAHVTAAPFRGRLDVLPGDANRSGGSVIGSDVTLVRNAQNASPGAPGTLYTIYKDVNGSGTIVGSDVTAVRNRQGLSLPAGEPGTPARAAQSNVVLTRTLSTAAAPFAKRREDDLLTGVMTALTRR